MKGKFRKDDQPAVRQRMILVIVVLLILLVWGIAHVVHLGVSAMTLLEGLGAWLAIFFVLRFAFSYRTAVKRKRRIKQRLKEREQRQSEGE